MILLLLLLKYALTYSISNVSYRSLVDVVYALKDEVQELKQVSVCEGMRKLFLIFK